MVASGRRQLERWLKLCGLVAGAASVYVLADFLFDSRPPGIEAGYRFSIGAVEVDRPLILRRDNLAVVLISRSADTIEDLRRGGAQLQDPDSSRSRQPGYAANPLRSRHPEYFVALAFGTDLGCPLRVEQYSLVETCGPARYDFAGRSFRGERVFRNLPVPDYNFSDDFRILTIRP